jgi:hypothetical protein
VLWDNETRPIAVSKKQVRKRTAGPIERRLQLYAEIMTKKEQVKCEESKLI